MKRHQIIQIRLLPFAGNAPSLNARTQDMIQEVWKQARDLYNHFTLHICPGPRSLSYLIPFLTLFLVLLTPPRLLSLGQIRTAILPVIYAFQLCVWYRHDSFDVISMNNVLALFMLLGYHDVRKTFKLVRRGRKQVRKNSTGIEKDNDKATSQPHLLEPYPPTLCTRLPWVLHLCSSLRLTDWHIAVTSHDKSQPTSVNIFESYFLDMLAHSLLSYVLLHVTQSYISTSPTFNTTSTITLLPNPVDAVFALTYLYAVISLLTSYLPTLLAILPLTIAPSLRSHPWSPLTWPSHFGSVTSIWRLPPSTTPESKLINLDTPSPTSTSTSFNNFTKYPPDRTSRLPPLGLRAFWSTFWHQNMRHLTTTPAYGILSLPIFSDCLAPTNSLRRYSLIIGVSFFFSGVVHMGVIPPYPLHTSWSVWGLRIRLAAFFWLQPLGMLIETVVHDGLVEWGGRRPGRRSAWLSGWRRMLLQSLIALSTVAFLGSCAWFTAIPVGREMEWWGLDLRGWSMWL